MDPIDASEYGGFRVCPDLPVDGPGQLGLEGPEKRLRDAAFVELGPIVRQAALATDELAVGQAEIARLWSLEERSVKREMARMRELGWISLRRPPAQGRVAVHGLDLGTIMAQTRAAWANLGSDFEVRMTGDTKIRPAPADSIIRLLAPSGDPTFGCRSGRCSSVMIQISIAPGSRP
ncbi:hypothetical protein LHP98_13210 [Rhodobacter sp. Har01]|uniref:hypothetical protein n=1 Tax=Rhodobacter sp. Har01 TaxID=2883999 RepID=UPI001D06C959|nr:hypothetical protein [Rhodobacter sp. Har01]MCB6179077.1 hypothetical protein [Rhodobacter sp. Har01]